MTTSRRQYIRRSAALALAAAAGCLQSTAPATDEATPTHEGGSDRLSSTAPPTETPTAGPGTDSATDPETPTDTPTTTDEPGTETATSPAAVAWRATFDGSVTTPPVVQDGWAYAGSEDGTVRRHGTDAGDVGWTFDAGVPIQDLAVGASTVFVVSGTNELGADQTLHALDATTGGERWTFSPTNWWLEILAVADGTVYVATADDALGPEGQTLYALAASDGASAWSTEIGDPREAVLTDDAAFVSTFGRIYALERDGGKQRWVQSVDDVTYTTPAVVDGTFVYASDDFENDQYGVLVGLDAASGAERWRYDGSAVSSTVARDETLYVGGAAVAALDPASGSVRWRNDTPGFVTADGVTADRVYAGGDTVQAYGRDGGELVWEWTPDPQQGGVFAGAVVDEAVLFDAYHDAEPRNQYKFAVDAADGTQRWAFEDGTDLTDLGVGDGVAVVGGENGGLYGLDVTGGP